MPPSLVAAVGPTTRGRRPIPPSDPHSLVGTESLLSSQVRGILSVDNRGVLLPQKGEKKYTPKGVSTEIPILAKPKIVFREFQEVVEATDEVS